jgi:hypothetical protein
VASREGNVYARELLLAPNRLSGSGNTQLTKQQTPHAKSDRPQSPANMAAVAADASADAGLLLHAGEFERASELAVQQCQSTGDEECAQLLSIVLQADYHLGRSSAAASRCARGPLRPRLDSSSYRSPRRRLKTLQELQLVTHKSLGALKIQVVLLW